MKLLLAVLPTILLAAYSQLVISACAISPPGVGVAVVGQAA